MTLPELAIRRPITTLMVLVSLVVLGGVALVRLPLAFLPEMEEPELFVIVPYPNATPTQVERQVIRPLEEALGSIKGLQSMWSMCNAEGGRVRLDFEWGMEMALVRMEVREKLERAIRELPEDVDRVLVSSAWDARESEAPILEGRLSSKRDLSESYDLLDRRIVKPLERIAGVAQVRLDGVNPKEVRINLRMADLDAHNIDIREVTRRLQTSNFDQSLGEVEEPGQEYRLRTVGAFHSVEEIRDLVLRADGLKLGDIAEVVYEEPPLEYGRHLDGEFAIGITVTQESSANTVEVCDEVKRRVEAMAADPELDGVNFLIWENQGEEIRKTLKDLAFTGVFGAILATIVLYLFLRRLSVTVFAVMCIPFSLIVACGFLWAQGKTLNTISLLGLIVGIGMLVDNAVVVMENIFRYQEEGYDRRKAARLGSSEVSTAVIAATLTSIIVFLPMIFDKPSEMNLILRELGITVVVTLLASLFISQTLIPLVTSHFLHAKQKPKGKFMLAQENLYARVLAFNLRHRWLTPVVGIAVTASAILPFQKVDKNFDTNETEMYVSFRYEFSEDLSLDRKEEVIDKVEAAIEPHRAEIFARSIYSFWSDRWAMTRIYLESGKTNEKDIAAIRKQLNQYFPELPGVKLEVMDSGPMWRQDRGKRVAFQIVGEDSEVLADLAEQAKEILGTIPGLTDPFSSTESGGEELHLEIDRDLATRYGVDPMQPAQVIQLTYRGRNLPRFRTPDGEREIRLTLDEKETESISQLRNLPVRTAGGEKVPLASMVDLQVKPGPERISRDDRLTNVWVGARYEEGSREDYLPAVTAAMGSINFPFGYEWTMRNSDRRRQEQANDFLINLSLALLLVFAVMAGLFESMRQAIALMVSLPFALAGAFWTLFLTGVDFDRPAAVGVLLLIGIVVNNGIVMLEHTNMYRRRGMQREEAMLRGGRERLRPILMTALTTLLGLLPIWIQKPALGGVYYYSMALVIMGGLLVSTFLTAVLLPASATLTEDILSWFGRVFSGFFRLIWRWTRALQHLVPGRSG